VPPEAGFARSVQRWAVGYALRIKGDLPGARRCFEEVLEIGYRLDNPWTIVTASVDLGGILRQQGELRKAEAVFRRGLKRAGQAAGGPAYVGRLEAFLASLLLERGALAEAGTLVEAAIAHNRHWENPNHCAFAWLTKASLEQALGKRDEAAAALAEAGTWVSKGPVVPNLQAAFELAQVRLWLQAGDMEQANAWLAQHAFGPLNAAMPLSEVDEALHIAAASALLADGRPGAARELLAPLAAAARRGGKLSTLVEALVLQAAAAPTPAEAAAFLREALSLGLRRGFRQVFLEQGSRLQPALESCQDVSGASELLLALRGAEKPVPAASPLTERELEVLRWMAAGLSNPEIGARLFISAGTVKAHTAAIYRKLDVANRPEAIARAKDLGLL
jgi:ATP/maltotriose-dependent transcriptional regulator MalT